MFELGIRCDHLLTMAQGNTTLLRDHFLGIQQGKITLIQPWQESFREQSQKFIETKNQLVMPGLINGHCHAAMSLFRGLAEDQTFDYWLHQVILPLEAKFVDRDFIKTGVELALLESIYNGVTTIADMFFFIDAAAEIFDRVGMRGLLIESISDYPSPDNKDPKENQHYQIIEKTLHHFKQHSHIHFALGIHAPYSCSNETLTKALHFAQQHDLRLYSHVAEATFEIDDSLKKYQQTPVARYAQLGLLDQGMSLVHCVHITDDDIALIADKKCGVIYNPESNMKLGCGIAPIKTLLNAGVPVGIGTDGAASNNDLNLFAEMSTGMKLQKLVQHTKPAITSTDMLRMATIDGARALGLENYTGSLEVGKFADCIILDLNRPELYPAYDLISHLCYAINNRSVNTVICHGKILLENQKPLTINQEKLFADVREISGRIERFLNTP